MSQPEQKQIGSEFDLRPDPRVLSMLGEINLEQWRCLAELIDNSVDGFLHASREGTAIPDPQVFVDLPNADRDGAMVSVRDNGPGMTPAILQNAVSAGWSGNNPVDNLGLFGMGFNIATARLGTVTEVWTTRAGDSQWHGLEIDFEKLRRQKHFKTEHLVRPKADHNVHGTEVTVKQLKPQQRNWLARTANQSQLRKRLSETYSAMLRANGNPLSFKLSLNNKRVTGRVHCVWGEDRIVTVPGLGDIAAVTTFDYVLAQRRYCSNCMNWLATDVSLEEPCPICATEGSIRNRARRIRGWVGIQRYLDKTEFGFDFIRNGRKIELDNKDIFIWNGGDGDEPEYPIDDQRGRGRFVGEIHLDHCRVSYAKDRFDRNDAAWEEMLLLIRGDGPLRPEKAKELGFSNNESPLFRLFRAFRRTSPQSKVAGAWKRIMVVKDNDRATDMARQFYDGHPDYQDDSRWFALIEEADRELLYGSTATPNQPGGSAVPGPSSDVIGEILGGSTTPTSRPAEAPATQPATPVLSESIPLPSLSRKYIHAPSGVSWAVEAFSSSSHSSLGPSTPWLFSMADVATRTYHFTVDERHEVFRSMTLTTRDALLFELATRTVEYLKETAQPPGLANVLTDFRKSYGGDENLDPRRMQPDAVELLQTISRAFVRNVPIPDRPALFNDLNADEQQAVMRKLASRRISPHSVIGDGSFLEFAPSDFIAKFVELYPEHCFDGAIWDEPYGSLDYGNPIITNEARAATRQRFRSLIGDVSWLATREASDLLQAPREELIRALMSLDLLRPDVEQG